MRKLIQRFMVVLMCMSLIVINPVNAFAATGITEDMTASLVVAEPKSDVCEVGSTRSTSFTMTIRVGQGYAQSSWMYIGPFSTIKVTGTGNSGMEYRVRLQGSGDANYYVGYLKADGSTLSKKMWTLPAGEYWIFIEPWNGTTNGQTIYFDVTIS